MICPSTRIVCNAERHIPTEEACLGMPARSCSALLIADLGLGYRRGNGFASGDTGKVIRSSTLMKRHFVCGFTLDHAFVKVRVGNEKPAYVYLPAVPQLAE